jgi:hypothetical protein
VSRRITRLMQELTEDSGAGCFVPNLRNMRQFYGLYPSLIDSSEIRYALRSESADESAASVSQIPNAVRSKSAKPIGKPKLDTRTPESSLVREVRQLTSTKPRRKPRKKKKT